MDPKKPHDLGVHPMTVSLLFRAVVPTAFPLVVYTTGVPGPTLIPLLAIAVGAWVKAARDAVRRRR